MTDPLVCRGTDGLAYVLLEEYERVRRKKEAFQKCLVDMARRMNQMADEIEREQPQPWTEPTAPAPLGDN
jgi:hypothetical protein